MLISLRSVYKNGTTGNSCFWLVDFWKKNLLFENPSPNEMKLGKQHVQKVLCKNYSICPNLSTNMPAIGNSCFWWVIFLIFSSEISRPNEPILGRYHVHKVIYKGSKVTVTHYISLKQSILLFSLFTDGGNLYLQCDLVQCWQCYLLYPLPTTLCTIVVKDMLYKWLLHHEE